MVVKLDPAKRLLFVNLFVPVFPYISQSPRRKCEKFSGAHLPAISTGKKKQVKKKRDKPTAVFRVCHGKTP